MPLFGNDFSPKKTPPRKSASLGLYTLDRVSREVELGLDHGAPVMNIGGQSLKFDNGPQTSSGIKHFDKQLASKFNILCRTVYFGIEVIFTSNSSF
ncbi:protein chibby homolog 1-like [Scyliorhinus canicula]|uniref:protein chibby homolog 1-like n=1 Tax=Scyliorhinus canicula TaxID=7830 RepID=UPI0018F43B65|nr:protein chibby homolog 1-like [Scyliorhinus canicula]